MALMGTSAAGPFRHFLEAQAPIYRGVLDELRRGRKESHWMWFVFPQLSGLGRSETARRFALHALDEAALYAAHPVLGARLRECTGIAAGHGGRSASDIFGHPDAMKFRSSMTLFETAVPGEPPFAAALERFFGGRRDELTLGLLRNAAR
jgi:uncharacterized protein (DUF1810 family)